MNGKELIVASYSDISVPFKLSPLILFLVIPSSSSPKRWMLCMPNQGHSLWAPASHATEIQ